MIMSCTDAQKALGSEGPETCDETVSDSTALKGLLVYSQFVSQVWDPQVFWDTGTLDYAAQNRKTSNLTADLSFFINHDYELQ